MQTATTTGGTAIEETDRLIASDRSEGTAVDDRQGERLGTVHNLIGPGRWFYPRDRSPPRAALRAGL